MNNIQHWPKKPKKKVMPKLCEECTEVYAAFKERKLFCDEDAAKLKDYISEKYGMKDSYAS